MLYFCRCAFPLKYSVLRKCLHLQFTTYHIVQITALHKEVGAFLGFGLGDAAHIPHLGVEVQIFVKMALIYKEPVSQRLTTQNLSPCPFFSCR